ncbi:MAG: N-6 DNA methylase [Lachnospiraceae bacterium]|nr:N-6 DNA methylase [Lachnospiraceae bacterium]
MNGVNIGSSDLRKLKEGRDTVFTTATYYSDFYRLTNDPEYHLPDEELQKRVTECVERQEEILSAMQLGPGWPFPLGLMSASYLLMKAKEQEEGQPDDFEAVRTGLETSVAQFLEGFPENVRERLWELKDRYSHSTFHFITYATQSWLFRKFGVVDGASSRLVRTILEIGEDDSYLEFCCDDWEMAGLIKRDYPGVKTRGYKLYGEGGWERAIRDDLLKDYHGMKNADITLADALDGSETKADRIFSRPPEDRLGSAVSDRTILEMAGEKITPLPKNVSYDWIYNLRITDLLDEKGRGVGIMTNGCARNTADIPFRKYFVENGLIECVIIMPPKLLYANNIGVSLVVFSHGNKGVRLIDASERYLRGRRYNIMTAKDVEAILEEIRDDGDGSFVSTEDLRENEYSLNPKRYFSGVSGEDVVAFSDVIKRITRGTSMDAKKLGSLLSQEATDVRYLTVANLQDGMIDGEMAFLTELDKKQEKYCLTQHCLLLSKNGFPYRAAVAELKEGEKILASANIYLIELDETRADPYYVAAFLGSERGADLLKGITVGTSIPNIGVEQLKSLVIPLPGPAKQKEIAEQYRKLVNRARRLREEMEETRKSLSELF